MLALRQGDRIKSMSSKKLKRLDDKYQVYYDFDACGWRVVVEGARIENCPLVFPDSWIAKVDPKQAKMITQVLKEHQVFL